jgi:hypothetical protein
MNIQSNVTTPFAFIFNIPSSSARGGLFKLRVLSFALKIATHSNALLFAIASLASAQNTRFVH